MPPAGPPPAPRKPSRRGAKALAAAVSAGASLLLAGGAGCEGGHGTLVVGVRPGRPGLVEGTAGGGYTGFEIAVAGYVARRLGYRDDQVTYVELASPPASAAPRRIDLAMGVLMTDAGASPGPYPASEPYLPSGLYSISGPYLVSGQDILTKAGDLSVRRLGDLAQKRVCTGSPGPLGARFGTAWQRVFMIASTVEDCVRMLGSRRVDAVTDDAAALAGLASASPGRFRLVGHAFSRDRYGIALREDGDLHEQVDDALRAMFDDGAWRRAVIEHLGLLATKHTAPPALQRYAKTRSAP
ncbi:substrate-binding periplasmic protein [Sphaerisporangium perillae]|uniref:substrate-binding periplasmic protein n=1 Tax=Sphaerisporangium perillae TaxID=2935860 RepID=UPI00200DB567|nr:transporter substrate-binding domain-containing protein [Sphaerisporangium perillae]